MKLEDIVVSLELAKELKEAGYPQEDSLFYWFMVAGEGEKSRHIIFNDPDNGYCTNSSCNHNPISAPTASELGEYLKNPIQPKDFPYGSHKNIYQHYSGFENEGINKDCWESIIVERNIGTQLVKTAKTEADARAEMWLYLKQNNLINKER